ncbi:hypothetical protein GCK72_004757 [Caenorhabditis remanei]|uniref:Uncharacterized protein n=1 Tax=Caenorhabditis remanei TaxID=31234 RepID=A0A6A5HCA6_CAERE|nr:hypothetical protein GCK72_004757 [Caenorhabditis remanei]KAF1764807.1 hypothetical protein GCK72_004757 [Caenorhabditis remanei]
MKIESIGKPERCEKTAKDWIFINYRKIKKSIIPGYFNFLNKVVGVKVEEIITKNLFEPEEMFARNLHNIIHSDLIGRNRRSVRKLIGLEEVCEGCVDCMDMATRCVEYGPLRFKVLKEIKKPIHYKKLHISDNTISCDTLLLWICETKECYVNGVQENAHFSMPREVLDVMIRTWNVKTIRMNMIACTSEKICHENWINKGYFTKIKLDDPYWKTGQSSDLKLKHVSVKVTDSYDCAGGLIYSIPKTGYEKNFENYIANLRRLFQMDKLSIDFSHWRHRHSASLEDFMTNILRVIQLEKQRKLEVNIQFFTETCSFKVGNSEKLAEIPSEYSLLSDRVECNRMFVPSDVVESGPERLNMIKWVGRRFQVKDMDNHFTLNLNIYVKETELRKLDKGLMETHPNSLIGVFFPQKPLEISRKLMAKRLVAKCLGAESIKIGLPSNVNDIIESNILPGSSNSSMPHDATQSFLNQKSFKNSPLAAPQKPKPLQQLMTSSGADQIQNHSFSTKATASPHPSYLPMLQDVQQILDSSAILLDGQHEAAANVKKMQAKMPHIRDALSPLFERMESSAALLKDILEKMGSSNPLVDCIKQKNGASSSLFNASYSPIFKFSNNVMEVEKLQNEVAELRNELEKERVRGDMKSREAAQNFKDLEVCQAKLKKVEAEKTELTNELSRLDDSHRRLVAELDEAKRQMEKTLVRCAAEQDARLNAEEILEDTKRSVEVLKREHANAMMIEVDYRVTEAKELVEREKKAIIESLSSELQTALAEKNAVRDHLERMDQEMELLRRRAREAEDRVERTANEKHEMVKQIVSFEEKIVRAAAFEKEAKEIEDMVNGGLERVRKEVVELTKKTLKTQIISGDASSIRLVCDELCRRLTREREQQHESAETMKCVNDNIEQLQKENLEMQSKIREFQGVSKKSSTSNNKENAPPPVVSSEAPITAPPSSSQKTSTTASNFVNPTRQLLHESTMAVDSIVQKLKKTYTMSGMGEQLKETIGNLIIESRGVRDFLHQKLILFKGIDMTMWKNDSVDQLVEKLAQYLQDNLILEEQIKKYKKELKLTKTVIPNLGANLQERIKREIGGIASDLGAVKALRSKK